MKQAVTGLIAVVVCIVGVWITYQVFSGADLNPFDGRSSAPDNGVVYAPRTLPVVEKAQLEVELSLVDADFAAREAAEARRPENRHIKIDR